MIILISVMAIPRVKAQCADSLILSDKERFGIQFVKGCVSTTIRICPKDTFASITRQYDYIGDNQSYTNETSFTYLEAGNFTIEQFISQDDPNPIPDPDFKFDRIHIIIVESILPTISLSKCSNRLIQITSNDTNYDLIQVYSDDADDTVVLSQGDSKLLQFNNHGLQTLYYKGLYQNDGGNCNLYNLPISIDSSQVLPVQLQSEVKEICQNQFSLSANIDAFDPWIDYQIVLSQQSDSTILYTGKLDTIHISYSNLTFVRDQSYCLQINHIDPCNNIQNEVIQFCDTPSALSLTPFEWLYSSYTDTGIFIHLDPVHVGFFNIFRWFDGTISDSSVITESFVDNVPSLIRAYTYQIQYIDSCGDILAEAKTHPAFIEVNSKTDNHFEVQVTNPDNFLGSWNQMIYYSGSDSTYSSGEVALNPFKIRLNSKDGIQLQCIKLEFEYPNDITVQSNIQKVKYTFSLPVPNAFSPNQDGLNDVFNIKGLSTSNTMMKIFNRWGDLIFVSNNVAEGWDGMIGDKLAPEETYLYEIIYELGDGTKQKQSGIFVLILTN